MSGEDRPWGRYDILYDGSDCKVKRITVKPQHRLSYQYHNKRSEDWIIISGFGSVILDGKSRKITSGNHVSISVGMKHRIINESEVPLIFVEVQTGSYFGEDDIVRLEDHYGRG